MAGRNPADVTNLDRYGNAERPWSRAHDLLAACPTGPDRTYFLSTTVPDGRPHTAGVGAIWLDGDLYFTSGAGTRKSRNMQDRLACTLAVQLPGIDMIFEGVVERATEPATLAAAAELYRTAGWPAEVEGDALAAPFSAPSAGPSPWQLHRFTIQTAYGVATVEPRGATRWRFD